MDTGKRLFSRNAGAIAAALIGAAVALVPLGSSQAQFLAKKERAQKKGVPPQIQRNAMPKAGMPNRQGLGPNRAGFGPNRFGQGARPGGGPNAMPASAQGANPAAKSFGPSNARNFGPQRANVPGANNSNAKQVNVGPGSRLSNAPGNFGNRQGNLGNRQGALGNNRPGTLGNRQGGFANRGNFGRGFTNRDPRLRVVNARTPQMRQVQRFSHRSEIFAIRGRMPVYPLPGERNFTGVPPVTETRYVSTEMVCQWGPDITPQRIEEIARQHNLTILATQRSALTGGTLVRFRIDGNRATRDVVRAMEAERIVSQPNYIYLLGQTAPEPAAAQSGTGDRQYVANKLRLAEVHKIATGKDVLVAVIDSKIDHAHPELAKSIAEQFDGIGKPEEPHTHGTGMAGAIVSQDRLMGVAPGARALAVHVFSSGTQQSPQATTQSIVAGLEWATAKGARIINMSFAGPYDPILALAMKKASEKGAILIAAVGNQGPKSPPLYPAADPRVIGVTAIDENDQLYKGSNVGAQVAVAAPGVDVMVPAPAGTYQLTTGTSVAAAHVSGVAALLLERHPEADAQTILEVLTSSATRLGSNKRDDKVGWGLIDPLGALNELDTRLSDTKVAGTAPAASVAKSAAPTRAPTVAPSPAAATTRPALPRPGIYLPKQ